MKRTLTQILSWLRAAWHLAKFAAIVAVILGFSLIMQFLFSQVFWMAR